MLNARLSRRLTLVVGLAAAPSVLIAQQRTAPAAPPAAAAPATTAAGPLTKLEAALDARNVTLVHRILPLGQIGRREPTFASAISVTRLNEGAPTRGVRFIASDGAGGERQAYLDY